MKIKATIAASFVAVVTVAAQVPTAKPPAKTAGGAAAPKLKAIWKPVPFNKDVNLNAVACVGPETCWAVGAKSTILFTTDGGTTWQVQLGGDPESARGRSSSGSVKTAALPTLSTEDATSPPGPSPCRRAPQR